MLYVPCGYVTTHRVVGTSNLLGIRIGALWKGDAEPFRDLKAAHAKSGQTSPVIEQALAFIEALTPPDKSESAAAEVPATA